VGTGFHPELTGRENIYLNGAILGMRRVEIKQKFDEIVDFAEVEKFLDTPVKHYSSGMYVRLAFAVAAHLEPEILVVDEVLAVGDAAFQKKCLGKMGDVAQKEGRTVLFVSHNMAAIRNLCQQGILLNYGVIVVKDKTDIVIEKYAQECQNELLTLLENRKDRQGTGNIKFMAAGFGNEKGEKINTLYSGQDVRFILYFQNNIKQDLKNLHIAIGIDNYLGDRITLISSEVTNEDFSNVPADINIIEIEIKRLPLTQGRYGFTIYSTLNGVVADWIQNAGFFDVESDDFYRSGKLPPTGQGNFLLNYHFRVPPFINK
jgi:lipopolysaccharide transport system ATP-binding protein